MAYRFLKNENVAAGIPASSPYRSGVSNVDDGSANESDTFLPYVVNPRFSFLVYEMWIETYLDAGMVLHKALPQLNYPVDTLASINAFDPAIAASKAGVNTVSNANGKVTSRLVLSPGIGITPVVKSKTFAVQAYHDTVQRMATSEYQFVLKGHAIRIGYQIPVPGIVQVAGVPAIPGKIQWSLGNRVIGNYSGVPLFFNQWELWYFVAVPPKNQQLPPPNVGQGIRADAELPQGMQVPWSQPDQQSVPSAPRLGKTFIP